MHFFTKKNLFFIKNMQNKQKIKFLKFVKGLDLNNMILKIGMHFACTPVGLFFLRI